MTETKENGTSDAQVSATASPGAEAASATAGATVDIQCNSILGVNEIIRMGLNTFFLPNVGLFNSEFIARVYPGVYSINGITMNRETIIQRYKTFGIYRREFINPQRVIINFDIVRACNGDEYKGLTNFEVTQKLFRSGICNNPVIDSIPVQKCGEANDSFDILDYDLLDDCSESNENIFDNECNKTYNFFTDLFDWRYVAFCNRNIVKNGYTGCVGVTEWYITEGIYEGVPFNQYGNFIDLDFVACANNLSELSTYREVVCFLMQFGFCDPDILLAVPEVQSCFTKQLTPFNYSRNVRLSRVIDNFINKQCISAEGANATATCGRGRARNGIRFYPDDRIKWAVYGNLANNEIVYTNSTNYINTNTNTTSANNLGNTTNIRNYGYFNPPPNTVSSCGEIAAVQTATTTVNGNSGCCGNVTRTVPVVNNTAGCGFSFPSAASRGRFDSLNERYKVRAQENVINQQLNPCSTNNCNLATTTTTNNIVVDNSVPIPSRCKCGAIFDSYATPNSTVGSNLPSTCPNCVRQYSAFQNVNGPIGPITPLTLTTQPFSNPLNGTLSNSVLVNNNNGNFNTTAGLAGLINANNGVGGLGLYAGGCCNNKSIAQPYYDNGTGTNFYNPYRSAYFS